MKKIGVALAGIICSVTAAPTSADPAGAAEFKGLPMGAPYLEVQKVLGRAIECPDPRRNKTASCLYAGVTYAKEIPKNLRVYFRDGKLDEVVMSIEPGSFDAIAAALVERHGKPRGARATELQNGLGAKFQGMELTWNFSDGSSIFATRYAYDSSTGGVTIHSADSNRRTAEAAKKEKRPAADL